MGTTHNLILSCPDLETVQYVLKANRIGIGRSADNQIRVNLGYISSAHCELVRCEEPEVSYLIRDLHSKNGIRINGEPLNRDHRLADGDRILFSESVAANYMILPEEAEPEEAAEPGAPESTPSAARYAQLDDRITAMAEKLERLEMHYRKRHDAFQTLMASLHDLQKQIETKLQSPVNPAEIRAMQSKLDQKTRHVALARAELDKTRERFLSNTAKVTVKAE